MKRNHALHITDTILEEHNPGFFTYEFNTTLINYPGIQEST
jgi:hypothetical protein